MQVIKFILHIYRHYASVINSIFYNLFHLFPHSYTEEIIGDGFKFKRDPFHHLLLQNQKICREIFSQEMIRPKALGLGNLFARWLGDCLGCINTSDPVWALLKKIFKPVFDKGKSDEMLMNEWFDHLKDLEIQSTTTERPIPIQSVIYNLPLKWIIRKIFGASFSKQHKEFFDKLEIDAAALMKESFTNSLAKYWWYEFLPTSTNRTLSRFEQNWQRILQLAESSAEVEKEGNYKQLLRNYDESGLGFGEFHKFSQTLVEIIYANQDVTLPSAAWLLTHYALYPDFEEISNFIEESARLAPVFPTSMPKITTKEATIEGILIPAGTTVLIDFKEIGLSSEWKMSDLNIFRSQRFKDIIDTSYMVSRFGCGGRKCPGRHVANEIFVKMLEHLQQHWLLIPAHPCSLENIEKDPSKPFSTPIFAVWPIQKTRFAATKVSEPFLSYYDCPPMSRKSSNPFVAISVNKKSPFLSDSGKVDMVVKFLANQEHSSAILIADEISRFNMEAFDHLSETRAREEALKLGQKFLVEFAVSIQKYGNGRVRIHRWSDLGFSQDIYLTLQNYPLLVDRARIIARNFINGRGQGKINNSYAIRESLVVKYILSEIPVLLCGLHTKGYKSYNLLYYCGSPEHFSKFAEDKNSLHNLILDIHQNYEFADIRKAICDLVGKTVKLPGFIAINLNSLKEQS